MMITSKNKKWTEGSYSIFIKKQWKRVNRFPFRIQEIRRK